MKMGDLISSGFKSLAVDETSLYFVDASSSGGRVMKFSLK
jgi:hypothetical protein